MNLRGRLDHTSSKETPTFRHTVDLHSLWIPNCEIHLLADIYLLIKNQSLLVLSQSFMDMCRARKI